MQSSFLRKICGKSKEKERCSFLGGYIMDCGRAEMQPDHPAPEREGDGGTKGKQGIEMLYKSHHCTSFETVFKAKSQGIGAS